MASFSFFTVVAAGPMTICFNVMRRGIDGLNEDSLVIIKKIGEFVVNVVSEPLVAQMNLTSTEFEPGVSKFDEAGLRAAPSEVVKPPRVGESLVSYERKLHQVLLDFPVGSPE